MIWMLWVMGLVPPQYVFLSRPFSHQQTLEILVETVETVDIVDIIVT